MSNASQPSGTNHHPTPRRRAPWLLGLALIGLIVAALVGWLVLRRAWRDEIWLIDEAVKQINDGSADRHRLLGPAAVFDETPVEEAEADARQADFFLRHPKLHITAVRRGEVVGGKIIGTPGRYILTTRIEGSTPPLRIRNDKGIVESPSRLFMMNPDLVVELRDGKVAALRAELHCD